MGFEYFEPKGVEEAIAILAEHGAAKPMAGGTDLLVSIRMEEVGPRGIVSLSKIPGLSNVDYDPDRGLLRIGAMATYSDVLASRVVHEKYAALPEACLLVGSVQIRNVGTIVGNICHASPSADTAGPLLAFDAQVRVVGPRGERVVPLEEFFLGPGQTILEKNEIVTELLIPAPERGSGSAYLKLSPRRAMDLAIASVAVKLTSENGICRDCRIALGAVGPKPLRATGAEDLLKGEKLREETIQRAGVAAAGESQPISDLRGSAEYRRDMIGVLVERATVLARERARD